MGYHSALTDGERTAVLVAFLAGVLMTLRSEIKEPAGDPYACNHFPRLQSKVQFIIALIIRGTDWARRRTSNLRKMRST